MGSKRKFAKDILSVIGKIDGAWVEPFVGGGNMMSAVKHDRRFGYDICPHAIAYLDAISKGWLPPDTITRERYKELKTSPVATPETGWAAYAVSFGGKRFAGVALPHANGRNYPMEAYLNAVKQAPALTGTALSVASYDRILVPYGSTVYCDPPYAGTTGYSVKFDSAAFWGWTRVIAKHSRVYVSEYNAPDFAKEIWRKEAATMLRANANGSPRTERLFLVRHQ